jgi:nucleoid DNA-binding protein
MISAEGALNKADLIETLAQKMAHTNVISGHIVDALFDIIGDVLTKGEIMQPVGFGAYYTTETKARTGRNSQIGEAIEIASCKRPKFIAGVKLKSVVNKR